MLDVSRPRAEILAAQSRRIFRLTRAHIAAITLDSEGALVLERKRQPYRTYAQPVQRPHVAGAGDTFISAMTLALAVGAQTAAAAELASAAATIVVSKETTAVCSLQELKDKITPTNKHLKRLDQIAAQVEGHRRKGERIVFTNGCFDIIHSGHIQYLNRAKSLGDILVVGVNSDGSVKRLKGQSRPINSLDDRIQVLAALSCIDYVASFDEDTPWKLINALRPDVFVKGGDYSLHTLPEAPLVEALGGKVQILPYIEDHSTTSIIERIRSQHIIRVERSPSPNRRKNGRRKVVGVG
jgi:D-beta-D-heptose 7-phosphate kinase/D-beta-D-heptose 1-phosphate adenosyltransferase